MAGAASWRARGAQNAAAVALLLGTGAGGFAPPEIYALGARQLLTTSEGKQG